MDKIPPKPIGESWFLRNSDISKWYKQHWYETFRRFHPSSFESTPSCWHIPWGVGQGHLPQHCYAQAGDWWESPSAWYTACWKWVFGQNYTEVWLMSLNVNQPNKFLILDSWGWWTIISLDWVFPTITILFAIPRVHHPLVVITAAPCVFNPSNWSYGSLKVADLGDRFSQLNW